MTIEPSPENLHYVGGSVMGHIAGLDAEISPPVFACKNFMTSHRDFVDQGDVDRQWQALKEHLRSSTFSEEEVLEVLRSGILQTETGKAIAGLFADAMLRSIRPLGTLTNTRLKEMVEAICNLPPRQWQAAFGENVRLAKEPNEESVAGFIQSHLDRSSTQRDERIANEELLSDAQWEAIKHTTVKARSYVQRTSDSRLNIALRMLEDVLDVRPTPQEAQTLVNELFTALNQPVQSDRVRWTDHFLKEVEVLNEQLKPVERPKETWLEWIAGSSWLESMVGRPVSLSAPLSVFAAPVTALLNKSGSAPSQKPQASDHQSAPDAVRSGSDPLPTVNDPAPTLLSKLQTFERNTDFFSSVTNTGPRVPESFAGKLLYVLNVLDTFGVARLDSRHISTGRPAIAIKPSTEAWKNGESNFSTPPFGATPEPPNAAIRTDAWSTLGQFAAQVDNVVSQIAGYIMPWDSVHGSADLEEVKVLLEPFSSLEHSPVYQPLSEPLSDQPSVPELNVVGEQLQGWLARMSASLISSGVAVLSRTGDMIEQNPGKTAGVFAAYMAISNFYTHWFLPEPEQPIDPLQGLELYPDAAPDENSVVHENIVEGLEDLFEVSPEFASEVKKLISKSDYLDPADDPQLIENLEALLQRPVPGDQNVTYQDYLDEITVLAASDAHDEFEADPDSESTTETAVTTDAAPGLIRKVRSLGGDGGMFVNMQTSESGVAAHASAHLLIEAGQRSLDAEISIRPGEEIAPGVTISQAADIFIKDFVELQTVLDPSLFILSSVEQVVGNSDLPDSLKSDISYKTVFRVEYDLPPPNGKHGGYFKKTSRHKMFTLAELLMGRHEKEVQSREEVKIDWPSGYTDGFKDAVKQSNLWKDYEGRSAKVLSQPKFFELWKDNFKFKLQHLVSDFREGKNISEHGREIADKFLKDEIRLRPVGIKQGKYSDMLHVSNAVFLTRGQGPDGLFVFLGGNETVIESPVELFKKDGKSIEEFPQLRNELSKRIPLKDLLARDDDDFKYSQGRFVWGFNPVGMFENYKWPFTPIIFGRKDGPTNYGEHHDAFKELFADVVDKAKSDMDMMTSTWAERTVDKLMGVVADSLAGFAIILALPGAAVAGIAFMMGASASAAQYVRGALNDDPLEANRHKANAVKGMVGQVAGPYIGKVLGKVFSKVVDSRIAGKIGEHLKYSGVLPEKVAKHFPKYGHVASPLVGNANKIEKWIAPRVRNDWVIQDKVNRKLTNNVVVGRLKSLGKGPQVAQRLMDRSRVLYFGGPKEGYVYRGFAMRGDMRPPHEVFANGFKSPVKGGVNSGVQTSGYYDSNGLGAFHNGGKQGGYTYLIDGRGVGAKDVLRNSNWQAGSGLQLGSNPYQVNYAKGIPGSQIVGAYDSAGKFIPNPSALSNAIKKSIPQPFTDSVPFPIKKAVQNANATHTPVGFPQ